MREYRELMAQQRAKRVWATVFLSIAGFVLCVGLALVARTVWLSLPEPAPTTPAPATVAPPTPVPTSASLATSALVTSVPPSNTPTPAETVIPTHAPTAVPLPQTSPTPASDPQGDVGAYGSGALVEGIPGGVDIRSASIDANLRVPLQSTGDVPAELVGWAAEDEVLLWLSLYDSVPDTPTAFSDWVFLLDVDGNEATGRPPGTVRANPDLGYEVAVGVSYNTASEEFEPYFLMWDQASSTLTLAPEQPRFVLGGGRRLIGLALSLEVLTETVERTAGVTLVPGEAKGRTAVQSQVGGQKVIDFYPDRPD